MRRTIQAFVGLAASAALLAGCTVKKQSPPEWSGPSEFATAITVTASPDTLRQDGTSQSQIGILALDSKGQPVRNLPVRLDVSVGGVIADFGQISSKNIVTSTDGRATAVYTAPNAPVDPVDNFTIVQILATPVGSDYGNATSRLASIRLVPPGVILPPNGTPTAAFTYAPSAPVAKSDITFDASESSDTDGQIISYAWNFGDGTTGSGSLVRHQYAVGGTYTVRLTVTDDRGLTATTSQVLSVDDTTLPVASFVYSPTSPRPNEDIVFNASASRAGTGRTIVSYDWDFGTGRTGSGITVTKSYDTPATYVITLVVTDDVGNKGTESKNVTVSSAALSPSFVFSPASPAPLQNVYFDASGSTTGSGRSIVSYDWNFGDNTSGAGRTVNHAFSRDGVYATTLTIKDDIGQTASTTKNVTVSSGAIVAGFSFSPSSPLRTDTVYFDAGDSSSPFGLTNWDWNFGDGTTGTGQTVSHSFLASCPGGATDKTFVVRLTVTDNMHRTATTTKSVPVKGCSA